MIREALTSLVTVLLFGVLPITLLYGLHSQLDPIVSVEVVEVASATGTVPQDIDWASIELPQKLCREDCSTRYKRYRVHAQLPDESVLYVPLFDSSMWVTVDGVSVATIGNVAPPVSDLVYQPQWVPLPSTDGSMATLEITVASVTPEGGRLAPFYVAPASQLRAPYTVSRWLSVEILQSVILILVLAALLALVLQTNVEEDRSFVWFAIVCVGAIVRALCVVFPDWPIDQVMRHWQYLASTNLVLLGSVGFLIALSARPRPVVEWTLVGYLLVVLVAALWFLSIDLYRFWMILNAVTQATGLVAIPIVLRQTWLHTRGFRPELRGAIVGWILVATLMILHDIVILRASPPLIFQLSNLAGLGLVIAFLLSLISRYQAMRRDEADARLRLASERGRLLADMHDTVAGRLAVLVQQASSGPNPNRALAGSLRSSLRDLRAAMDSLDPEYRNDLGRAFEQLRLFNTPLFERADIELNWAVPDRALHHDAETVLQIVRIVQEALTNALRHSQASRVSMNVAKVEQGLRITVADDGVGFDAGSAEGRGLSIQRNRASAANIELSVETGAEQGTIVSLLVPYPPIHGDSKRN